MSTIFGLTCFFFTKHTTFSSNEQQKKKRRPITGSSKERTNEQKFRFISTNFIEIEINHKLRNQFAPSFTIYLNTKKKLTSKKINSNIVLVE